MEEATTARGRTPVRLGAGGSMRERAPVRAPGVGVHPIVAADKVGDLCDKASESTSDLSSESSSDDSSSGSSSDSEIGDSHIGSDFNLENLGAKKVSKPASRAVFVGLWHLEPIREEDANQDMQETEAAIRLQRWFQKIRHEFVVDEFDEGAVDDLEFFRAATPAAPQHHVSVDHSESRLHALAFDMYDKAIQEDPDFRMATGVEFPDFVDHEIQDERIVIPRFGTICGV